MSATPQWFQLTAALNIVTGSWSETLKWTLSSLFLFSRLRTMKVKIMLLKKWDLIHTVSSVISGPSSENSFTTAMLTTNCITSCSFHCNSTQAVISSDLTEIFQYNIVTNNHSSSDLQTIWSNRLTHADTGEHAAPHRKTLPEPAFGVQVGRFYFSSSW